jgi:hypothetical protein
LIADELRDLDLLAGAAPPAPPPEPMTVARMIGILKSRYVCNGFCSSDWPDVEADLTALVQAQARRDAEIIENQLARLPTSMTEGERNVARWLHHESCRDILKAAGLQ